ncbi:MAG: hypothetical protein HXY34_12010 [Candidatus Thorarchaeota archaeon]|nr:hypothetical protein [Candidatus Thorarchaeota archaeon]
MMVQGWLLDASIDRDRDALTLWIKSNGQTRGCVYRGFQPSVFVSTGLLGSGERERDSFRHAIMEHEAVTRVEAVRKYLSVYDDHPSDVLEVFTRLNSFHELARDLEQIPGVTVYHADINPVQQFFIAEEVFPFGRVEVEMRGEEITKIKCLDRREDTEYETPELEEMQIEVFVDTKGLFPRDEDPIHHIEVHHRKKTIVVQEEDERETLLHLQRLIDTIDPDIIVTRGGDEDLFRYLSLRCKVNGVVLVFSRDGTPLSVTHREHQSFWQYNQVVFRAGNQVMFNGRIHIDRAESLYYSPSGLEGIIEGCRLALVQPQRVARMSIGSINAAVQYYTAYKRGILIPPVKRNPEFLKTMTALAAIDRGGLILQPEPDVYDSVIECDFASMYPTLMVTRNISPETVCARIECPHDYKYCIDVPGVDLRICNRRRGIVAESLELVVRKRAAFKRAIAQGRESRKYELMQNTLKGVLVSCFGYLGFRNARFGRVEAHTAVTAFARDVLLTTQAIGESMGFEVIHGIVDSLWLRSAEKPDYDRVQEFCRAVSGAVGIEMSLKGTYRWMVIPSSRIHSSISPMNRYYGVYLNGSIRTRGIETRRRDTCLYVGDCQKEMIKTLARAKDRREFIKMIPSAWEVCRDFIDGLLEGDVDIRDLVLHSRLTRMPHEYRTTSRASVVARQLVTAGRELCAGQKVRYILTEPDSMNPNRRVRALELLDPATRYDSHAYAILCVRAFESLIPAQLIDSQELDSYESLASAVPPD